MTVAEINALLYSPDHPRERLRARRCGSRRCRPGGAASFEALLQSQTTGAPASGNAGLAPAAAAHPAAPGFRPLVVTAIDHESADVLSLTMQSADGQPLPTALPGQYVVLRLRPTAGGPPLFRSYSLSGAASTERYRISVKVEPNGVAATTCATMSASAMRSTSARRAEASSCNPASGPVVLLSAGIGATPVLAMLHALAGGPLDPAGAVAARRARSAASSLRRRGAPPDAPRSRAAAATSATAGPARATSWARTSTPPATCRGRSSTRSASHATPTSTSAGRPASWRR